MKTTSDKRGVSHLLGEVTLGRNNTITAAKATKMMYFLQRPLVDTKGPLWEKAFAKYLDGAVFAKSKIAYFSLTGYFSDMMDWISDDLKFLAVSVVLAMIYLVVMLGTFSRINHKVREFHFPLICFLV